MRNKTKSLLFLLLCVVVLMLAGYNAYLSHQTAESVKQLDTPKGFILADGQSTTYVSYKQTVFVGWGAVAAVKCSVAPYNPATGSRFLKFRRGSRTSLTGYFITRPITEAVNYTLRCIGSTGRTATFIAKVRLNAANS